jgi:hypothetical protein
LDLLNRAGEFAAKRLQGLAPTTASAGALRTVGLWSSTGFIDKKKRLFLGTLCRLPPSQLHKKIFVYRLFSFIYYNELSSVGYVTDISELKQVTFLTTRTSTGSKVDVFHQSQPLIQSSDVTHAVRVVKNVTCLSSLLFGENFARKNVEVQI